MQQVHVIISFIPVHGTGLPSEFSEREDEIMANLNILNPISPRLGVINVADASSDRVGCSTTISDVDRDTSIMFGKDYLHRRKHQKRTMVATTS